jgi:hypothetical protein
MAVAASRTEADRLAAGLPAIRIAADRLAATVMNFGSFAPFNPLIPARRLIGGKARNEIVFSCANGNGK